MNKPNSKKRVATKKVVKKAVSKKTVVKTPKIYVIRAKNAGVFYGEIVKFDPKTLVGTFKNLRRIYSWKGALDVITISKKGIDVSSQLSCTNNGTSTISEIIEFHSVSKQALIILNSIPDA